MGLIKISYFNGGSSYKDYGDLTDGRFHKPSLKGTLQPKRMYSHMGTQDGQENLYASGTV